MEKCTFEGCDKFYDSGSERKDKQSLASHFRFAHKGKVADMPVYDSDIVSARERSETVSETLEQKVARIRQERVPISSPEKKWSCPANDGYHYRVFNDEWAMRPDNIARALKAGYEFVGTDNKQGKSQVVGTNDNGKPIFGYLMKIPKVIFEEDQQVKQKVVDRVDAQIKSGNLQSGAGDGRYIPSTGIKILSDNRAPE